jgi:glycerophosphoryl diester phosphodiesterase
MRKLLRNTCVAVVLCGWACLRPAAAGAEPEPRPRPIHATTEIVAHRGYNKLAPENTYASARLCVEHALDWVEVDVRRTKDGVHIVLHDSTLDRTTTGRGPVRERTWDEIAHLDAGSWFDPAFAGERIPRLDEFLAWAHDRPIGVYLDVKDADVTRMGELVESAGMAERVFAWSGNPLLTGALRSRFPWMPLKLNAKTPADIRDAARWGAAIVELSPELLTPEATRTARELGIRVMVYTTSDDAAAFEKAVRLGADLVNLDHPDTFMHAERRMLCGPLPMHTHNDYEHDHPLADALAAGAASVEADVFLIGGEVLVAHEQDEAVPGRTFGALYIEPIASRLEAGWSGDPPRAHLFLLVDLKQPGPALLRAVMDELEPLRPHLTAYEDGSVRGGAVTVLLSGAVPRREVAAMRSRVVFLDGRPADLEAGTPADLAPLISERWTGLFDWRGGGDPSQADLDRLGSIVVRAHERGQLVRFWAAPDSPRSWEIQHRIGVDLINTDRPDAFRSHFRTMQRRPHD